MEQTTKETRTVISVDRLSYDLEQQNYIKKVKLEDAIFKEVYKLLPSAKVNEMTLLNDVISEFYKLVELEYAQTNTMRLKGIKLVELLDIDTTILKELSNQYNKLKNLKQPNIESFYTYVDNDAERERYILCKKVVNLLNEVSQKHQLYGLQLTQGFNHLVVFNRETQKYLVNVSFIKNLRY